MTTTELDADGMEAEILNEIDEDGMEPEIL